MLTLLFTFSSFMYLQRASRVPFYCLFRDWGEADWMVHSWVLLPAVFDNRGDIFSSPQAPLLTVTFQRWLSVAFLGCLPNPSALMVISHQGPMDLWMSTIQSLTWSTSIKVKPSFLQIISLSCVSEMGSQGIPESWPCQWRSMQSKHSVYLPSSQPLFQGSLLHLVEGHCIL